MAIKLTKDRSGRASGEGYVIFSDRDDFEHGLTKHKSYIGKRYIEVCLFSLSVIEHHALVCRMQL